MLKPARKLLPSGDEPSGPSNALQGRTDAGKLTRPLALCQPVEPDEATRTRRIVDTASARLWLADGIPFADAITMLEVRRRFELSPDHCRAHAVEIVWTAWQEISPRKDLQTTRRKEPLHAIA